MFYAKAVETTAPLLSITPFAAAVHNAAEMEREIDQFARESDGALLVLPDLFTAMNRQSIIALAAQHRLPAVYPMVQIDALWPRFSVRGRQGGVDAPSRVM